MTEQIRILQRRLKCFSRDLKVLWITCLKSVFNAFRTKPSLGSPELLTQNTEYASSKAASCDKQGRNVLVCNRAG